MEKWTANKEVNCSDNTTSKPSKLWFLYHSWGGICLWLYMEVSGLSNYALPTPSGSSHASASSFAGKYALLNIGMIALGYFLSKVIIDAIDRRPTSNKLKKTSKAILPIIYLASAIFLSALSAPLFLVSAVDQKKESYFDQLNKIKPVIAISITQSSEGITELDFNQNALTLFEYWLLGVANKKLQNKYKEMGLNWNDNKPKLSSNSAFVTVGGKKLGLIKINMDNTVRMVSILGFKGDTFHRVNCMREGNHEISVWSGVCGNEISKTFGLSLLPEDYLQGR